MTELERIEAELQAEVDALDPHDPVADAIADVLAAFAALDVAVAHLESVTE